MRARGVIALLLAASACAPASRAAAEPSSAATVPVAVPASPALGATEVPGPEVTPRPSPTPIAPPTCAGGGDGLTFERCPPGVHIAIDAAIGERDAALIAAQVVDDVAAVQQEFEWTLRAAPRIDVYATTARYAAGLHDVFGYSQATARYLAENSVAFFEPALVRIAVSWEAISDRRPIAAIRHELVHVVTLEACAPRCDLVPAWLNEGEARLAEALLPGADWRLMRVRYEAASMVATATVLPLTALWTQLQWNAVGDWAGYYKYQEAARAVELLRLDVGERAIARFYGRIRAGDDVARAYAAQSGKSFTTFLAALSDRLAADVTPGPAIALVAPGADGSGASYLLYGFPAEAKVALRIRARHADETQELALSPQGAHFGSLDDTYPPGTYTITATVGATIVTANVTKRGGRARAALPEARD